MTTPPAAPPASARDAQRLHWEATFLEEPDLYGLDASVPAQDALRRCRDEGLRRVLELGAGQGRDALAFARAGLEVTAVEYAASGVEAMAARAREEGLADRLRTIRHDVRERLPFPDGAFDACYSHMLFNMAFTTEELLALMAEVERVTRPGGLILFTARSTEDAHHGKGLAHGDDLFEMEGFIVHFVSRDLLARLAGRNEVLALAELEEGPLPRRLHHVVLRRHG